MERSPSTGPGQTASTPAGCGARFGIGAADRLVLGALRSVALHGLGDRAAEQSLHEALGAPGLAAAIALKSFIAGLSSASRRTIAVGVPCRPCVTPDELALLGAIAAAGRCDFDRAHALIGGFAERRHVDALTHAAEGVADALAAAGAKLGARA
ncbi:MAG: hypothetical protein INF91_05860 [Alphaproteobacteria bacterium]|nr:hypothetical protein [Alphaproteobacteria bacterium]